jgi:O-antigen/teichoic acid export membrane protein
LVFWSLARLSHLPPKAPSESLKLSATQRQELFSVAAVLLANQLLAFATVQIDIWLAGSLLSPEALGLYGAAKRSLLIAVMPVQMAMLTIVSTIPRLHAQRRTAKLEEVIRGAATAAAIPSLIAIAVLAMFPSQVLTLILGSAYATAAPALLVMSIGQVVLVLSGNPQHVLAMTGRHRIVLIVNLLSATVLVIAGSVGAVLWGPIGLAGASAISLALQNGLLWVLARRELGIWTHVGYHRLGQSDAAAEFPATAPIRAKMVPEFTPVAEPVPSSSV